jgi:hypothetical protein
MTSMMLRSWGNWWIFMHAHTVNLTFINNSAINFISFHRELFGCHCHFFLPFLPFRKAFLMYGT